MTRLDEMFVPFALFISIKFIRVLITKTALTKLLENTLDESSKLKNMSDERLGCPTKSLLSQNFYRTMLDLSKTLILHPASSLICTAPQNMMLIRTAAIFY